MQHCIKVCSMKHSAAKEVIDKQLEAKGVDDGARRQWILMNLMKDHDSGIYREGLCFRHFLYLPWLKILCFHCCKTWTMGHIGHIRCLTRWQPNVTALSECFESDLLLVPSRHLWTPFRHPTR